MSPYPLFMNIYANANVLPLALVLIFYVIKLDLIWYILTPLKSQEYKLSFNVEFYVVEYPINLLNGLL